MSFKYKDYLKTEYWINLRNKILKRDNYRCTKCGSKRNLQVHHKKYRGYYKELPKDLITLCSMCHWYQHSYLRKVHIFLEVIIYIMVTIALLKLFV